MKINFGKYKNRNLIIGNNQKMRPTQSMAKSKIFNLIDINENSFVVDLFAGTGALGFESASLGASKVSWIDNNKFSVQAISKNIENLKLNKNDFKVFNTDFRRALKKIDFEPNIIFLDPPFIATKYYDEALKIIYNDNILAKNGIIILEKEKNIQINEITKFEVFENRKLGEKEIIILKWKMKKI